MSAPDETQEVIPTTPQPTGAALRGVILGNKKLKSEIMDVPEWGVTVEIREMMAKARSLLMQSTSLDNGSRDLVKFYPMLTIASCFDPTTGEAIFQPTDRDELNAQGGTAMERVCVVAVRLSGLNQEALDAAKKP